MKNEKLIFRYHHSFNHGSQTFIIGERFFEVSTEGAVYWFINHMFEISPQIYNDISSSVEIERLPHEFRFRTICDGITKSLYVNDKLIITCLDDMPPELTRFDKSVMDLFNSSSRTYLNERKSGICEW